MVILIEDKERAIELHNNLLNKLEELGLEINDKSLKGKVKDYKYDVINQDVSKYFIDGIDESTPSIVVNKAIQMINDMLSASKEKSDFKEIPFYLTHLVDKNYLSAKKEEIIEHIINTKIGRGSMFKHFYRNVFFTTHYDESKEYYKRLEGLSRGNFINQLSKNIDKVTKKHIQEIVEYYLKDNIEEYERYELYRIILLLGLECDVDLSSYEKFDEFVDIVTNTEDVYWNEKLLRSFLIGLQNHKNPDKIVKCLDGILKNSKSIPNHKIMIDTLYSITKYKWNHFSNKTIQLLYNFTALMTMYVDNEGKLKDIWARMINKYGEFNVNIKYNEWYKYNNFILKNEIVDKVVVNFLLSTFNEIGIIEERGTTDIEKECALYLVLYLFGDKSTSINAEDFREIKELLKNKNLEFLLWCMETNVTHFPSNNIALKNIYINDRVLLRKSNKLMIRAKSEFVNNSIVNENDIIKIKEENWYSDAKYSYAIIKLNDELIDIRQKIKKMNYYQAIDFVVSMKEKARYNNKYVNVFEKGAFSEKKDEIHISISKHDNKHVINDEQSIFNNEENFFSEIIQTICTSEIQDIKYDLGREYKIKDFKSDFIPSILKRSTDQFQYLEILNEEIKKNIQLYGEHLYSIELSKINAIGKLLKKERITKYLKEIQVIKYYNSLYDNYFEKFILYGKVEIRYDNLFNFVETIRKSINSNLDFDELGYLDEFLKEEYIKVLGMIGKMNIDELKNVEQVILKRDLSDNLSIRINNNKYKISTLNYYELGSTNAMKKLDEKDIFDMLDYLYIYKYEELIIKIPRELVRILEIIENKFGNFDENRYMINTSISNCEAYRGAVEVIINQSNVSEHEAKRRIINYLKDKDEKYFDVILKIISKYKYITEDEMQGFIEEIITWINEKNSCIMQLKKESDDNGLHQIIYGKFKDNFERGSDNRKRISEDYKLIDNDGQIDQLVIVNDVAISGTQFTNVINNILNKKIKKDMNYIKKEKFEELLNNKVKIVIVNCLYTDKSEEKIRTFLADYGYDETNLIFKGTKIDYKKYLFINSIYSYKDRKIFKEFVEVYYSNYNKKIVGNDFKDFLKDIEKDSTTNMLIARYKSMPKYHLLFLSDNTNIFKYREDK